MEQSDARDRLPENLTVEDMVNVWAREYRDLSEDKIPMNPEEIEETLETIRMQTEGLKERKAEVEKMLERLRSGDGEGDEEALVAELDEMTTEIPELEEHLFLLEEGREMYVVRRRQFRRYTKEEAASEAQILQELLRRGLAEDYAAAEKLFASKQVDMMLDAGFGWEALRIAIESGIVDEDIINDAMDRVEQNIQEARTENNERKLKVSEEELQRITRWRLGS